MVIYDKFRQIKYEKILLIRKALGLTQKDVADKLGIAAPQYSNIENGKRALTPELVAKLRIAMDITKVPLTPQEVKEFEEALWTWRDNINAWMVDSCIEAQPLLERCARLSFESDLYNLYTLISVGFYRLLGKKDEADAAVSLLEKNYHNLSPANKIRFLIIRGTGYIDITYYTGAFADLYEAYKLDKTHKVAGHSLYYALAQCLTIFGYSYKAIDLITKACEMAKLTKNADEFINSANLLLAINLARIGMQDKAFELLGKCLEYENAKYTTVPIHAAIYYTFAAT
ncbi:MAG: helix-turn-helix domain-containing protein, partial [Defluviitaleaceae bacterium]|nr:helix-turn-helix domain-containing protein [Defluviitaleaceae bacterium]